MRTNTIFTYALYTALTILIVLAGFKACQIKAGESPTAQKEAEVEKEKYVPTQEDKFKGKQLIGKSDRIVLQAKTDSIILSARQATSVAAQSINLDSTQYIGLDSPKIFLGNKAKIAQTNPV